MLQAVTTWNLEAEPTVPPDDGPLKEFALHRRTDLSLQLSLNVSGNPTYFRDFLVTVNSGAGQFDTSPWRKP